MSKLNIDQQTIKELFANKRSDFLIPDYQRPYAWGEAECQTLWDDIFAFAFPENDYSRCCSVVLKSSGIQFKRKISYIFGRTNTQYMRRKRCSTNVYGKY